MLRRSSIAVRVALAAALAICSASEAGAQPATAPIADLLRDEGALAAWLASHNRDAAAAAARVSQAQAAALASRLRLNPQVTATLGGIPTGDTNPPGLGWGDTVNYGASVSQIFEIGKRQPRSAAAQFRLSSEQQALSSTLTGSMADAREAMARVLHARSRKSALTEALDTMRQILDLQRVRLERGDLSGIDFDRLQLDAQVVDADLAQATADLTDALVTCQNVLFASCDGTPGDLDAISTLLQAPDGLLPPGWDAQLPERPDVKALAAEQQAAIQDAVLARRRRVPDPMLSVGFTRDRFVISGNNPRTLMVGVTVPLAVFDRGQHDAARAEAAARELDETQAALLARAQADALALRDRARTLSASLDALRQTALARATDVLTATTDAVNQGELSTTDLLLARRTRTDLSLKVMDLQLQLFLAQNALRQVLGLDAPVARRVQGATWPTP
ncbi:MAG: TolC family protein [Acidobacteria bacterium]|nr:TolC family protein [Acidobacteriota bacterium]